MCLCVRVYVCKYACICMHFQVFTATSLAWSHEVNPGGFHWLQLRERYPGQTSAVCVDVAAPEQEALQPERAEGLAR